MLVAYTYFVLCMGCCASYLGAPSGLILATGAMLAIPNVWRKTVLGVSAQVLVAMTFAAFAHVVGRGIAKVIGV
jgi:hypothetical protein